MLTISAVRDAQGITTAICGLFSDITGIKEHQSQLEHIAHFDALTNLPNRVLLATACTRHGADAPTQHDAGSGLPRPGRVQGVNDTHGHEMGDQLLIALAARMKHCARATPLHAWVATSLSPC
jgi:GGDEF domain-containing protein